MSKLLTFADGRTFSATDSSTIHNLKAVCASFAEVDTEWEKFTVENMTVCNFDGTDYSDIVPVSVNAFRDATNILLTVVCRDLSQTEILQRQADQIAELQEAVAELG